ncbi:MAG: 50S ribosomal protein L29 [Patescibacteria group bacterium]
MKELKDLKLLEVSKLREMTSEDLILEEKRASKELFTLTMRLKVGELKQTHLVKVLRRYLAQVNTVATSK